MIMDDMPDILQRICADKRREIEGIAKAGREELGKSARDAPPVRGFIDALSGGDTVAVIAEVKKASPSAGIIRRDFDPAALARAYLHGGARCISVLTDRKYFSGELSHLQQVRKATTAPVLRKDFILDEIQIVQSRACGVDCVLLIAAALDDKELVYLTDCARRWGLDALVEVHTASEMQRAIAARAPLIGINNRNLHTFEVDLSTTEELAPLAPRGTILVGESGINTREDIERLARSGIAAVLVGEALMRAPDTVKATSALCNVEKRQPLPEVHRDEREMERKAKK